MYRLPAADPWSRFEGRTAYRQLSLLIVDWYPVDFLKKRNKIKMQCNCQLFVGIRETGCPGKEWNHHPCRYWKALWNLLTWLSGGLAVLGILVDSILKVFPSPNKSMTLWLPQAILLFDKLFVLHPNTHISLLGSPFFAVFPFVQEGEGGRKAVASRYMSPQHLQSHRGSWDASG